LKRPFDKGAISAKVAAREGRPVGEVLAEWKQKSHVAVEAGKRLHTVAEGVLKGNAATVQQAEVSAVAAWRRFWYAARSHMNVVKCEEILFDKDFWIAGTLDALLYSLKTKQNHVFDWKTGKFEVENRWGETLLAPFDDQPATHLVEYSLQVSLYRLMLERAGVPCGDSWLVHCAEQATPHRAIDFRGRLEKWLAEAAMKGKTET
jgi:ATP-dependent exoDNAse (exonuclease V) beta subunit